MLIFDIDALIFGVDVLIRGLIFGIDTLMC